jgi:hypothetical protein
MEESNAGYNAYYSMIREPWEKTRLEESSSLEITPTRLPAVSLWESSTQLGTIQVDLQSNLVASSNTPRETSSLLGYFYQLARINLIRYSIER